LPENRTNGGGLPPRRARSLLLVGSPCRRASASAAAAAGPGNAQPPAAAATEGRAGALEPAFAAADGPAARFAASVSGWQPEHAAGVSGEIEAGRAADASSHGAAACRVQLHRVPAGRCGGRPVPLLQG